MVNRYSVLPDQKVINTFVEPNYQLLDGALGRMQQVHDEAELLRQQQSDRMKAVETRPIGHDIAEKNRIVSSYENDAEDILKKHNGDYGAASKELKALASKYAGDEFWGRNTSAVEQYKEAIKRRGKLQDEGKTILDYDSSVINKRLRNEDGSFNNLGYNAEARLDWIGEADKLIKGTAADGFGGFRAVTDADGNTIMINESGEQIKSEKIRAIFDKGFAGTDAYAQIQRVAYASAKDEKEAKQLIDAMVGELRESMVDKYSFKKTKQTGSFSRGHKKDDVVPPSVETSNSRKVKETDKHRVSIGANSIQQAAQDASNWNPAAGLISKVIGSPTISFTDEQKNILKIAQEMYGEHPSSVVDQAKLINKYLDFVDQNGVEPQYLAIKDPKVRKRETEYYFGEGTGGSSIAADRSFKLVDGDGLAETNGTAVLKEYPKAKYEYTVLGTHGPDNPDFANGKRVRITDKDSGELKAEYTMSAGTSEVGYADQLLHSMYKSRYNPAGTSEVVMPVNGKITPVIVEHRFNSSNQLDNEGNPILDGTGKYRVLDKKGNVIYDWVSDGQVVDPKTGQPLDGVEALYDMFKEASKKK